MVSGEQRATFYTTIIIVVLSQGELSHATKMSLKVLVSSQSLVTAADAFVFVSFGTLTPILNLQPICVNWSQHSFSNYLFILFHLAPIVKLHYNRQLLTTALTELEHCLQGMEEHPTASWQAMQDGSVFYRRQHLYTISGKLPDFSDYIVAGCRYGGPIGVCFFSLNCFDLRLLQ